MREMQMKTTVRYHIIPVRMAIVKKPTNNKCWKRVERKEPSHSCGNVHWCRHYGE